MKRFFLLALLVIILLLSWFSSFPERSFKRQELTIYVEGAVVNDRELKLPVGTKLPALLDYIELTETADRDFFKQQITLKDQDLIRVPEKRAFKKISLNTASLEELCQLKGIGPVLAQRIIDYRQAHGLFQKLEELKNIKGIKDKTFEKIRDYLCL